MGGRLEGPADRRVLRAVPSDSDDLEGISFAEDADHLAAAEASGVGAVIVGNDCAPSGKPHIVVADPRSAFAAMLAMMVRPLPIESGVHSSALVMCGGEVDPTAKVGPYAIVEAGARVGPGARVYPFCYVGENCTIGEGSVLYPHVVLYRDVQLGRYCVIHSGAVLGADGFGYVWTGAHREKVPQVGEVKLGDEVEVGANSAIDRATAGATTIGQGTKIDNLVQVGHNVRIGDHCVIAGQAGLSGSSRLGHRVTMGGQAALSHHAHVGDDIVLGGRTGVTQDIEDPGEYAGLPAMPLAEALRSMALATRLPELLSRIRKLEKRIEEMEGK